jgi:hypothetical protein
LLLYHSVRRHFRDEALAVLSSSMLLLCVPFLLHARQCKYFPFAALFTVAALDAYLLLRNTNSQLASPYFVLAGFCLFQSNFGAFFPAFAGLGLHFLLHRPTRQQARRMIPAVAMLALLLVPWAIYLQTWARGRFFFDIYRFASHLAHYVVYITGWVLPWPLVLLFGFLYLRGAWKRIEAGSAAHRNRQSQPGTVKLSGLAAETNEYQGQLLDLYVGIVLVTVVFLAATFIWMYFSYIVQLVPLLMVILAFTVLRILRRCRGLGYAVILLLVETNVLHVIPYVLPLSRSFKWASLAPRQYLAETDALVLAAGGLRFDLMNYAYELSHDYDGPDEGIVLFLREYAAPSDTVLANYGELPIAFYTGLDVAGGLAAYRLGEVNNPEWVIDREGGPYREEMALVTAQGGYEAIAIPYPDILWGNRPAPEYHKFATVHGVPEVVIHRRLD